LPPSYAAAAAITLTNTGSTATVNTPGALTAYAGYNNVAAGFTGGTNTTNDRINAATGNLALTSNYTANSLKIEAPSAAQSLALGGNTLTLTNGGVLMTGANDFTISGGTVKSNTSANPATNSDLVINHYGVGPLTISAVIANGNGASTLSKGGPGTLVLSGSNTYTGATYLGAGVTSISANANLGAEATGAALNMTGGTLQATGSFGLFNGAAGTNDRNVILWGGGGTFDVSASNTLTISGIVSNINTSNLGPLVKTGTGTLVLSGAANTYTGATIVNAGTLSVSKLADGLTNSSIGASSLAAPAFGRRLRQPSRQILTRIFGIQPIPTPAEHPTRLRGIACGPTIGWAIPLTAMRSASPRGSLPLPTL